MELGEGGFWDLLLTGEDEFSFFVFLFLYWVFAVFTFICICFVCCCGCCCHPGSLQQNLTDHGVNQWLLSPRKNTHPDPSGRHDRLSKPATIIFRFGMWNCIHLHGKDEIVRPKDWFKRGDTHCRVTPMKPGLFGNGVIWLDIKRGAILKIRWFTESCDEKSIQKMTATKLLRKGIAKWTSALIISPKIDMNKRKTFRI